MLIENFAPRFKRGLGLLTLMLLLSMLSVTGVLAQNTQDCEAGFRLFAHELLATDPICIPANPQRIVALDLAAAELLLFTDKELVGTFDWIILDLGVTMPPLKDDLANVQILGWPANLETILALKPDLIASYNDESLVYDELSTIAPTVTLSEALGDWSVSTGFWADVFNVRDVFVDMQATYEARVKELQQALGDNRGDLHVSVVHSSPFFTWIALPDSPQGILLTDVGLGRPEAQSYSGDAATEHYGSTQNAVISDETLNLADGDVILLFSYANDDEEILQANQAHLDALIANPLWQSLHAVKASHVYLVGPHWYRAATYLVANLMLDDLFHYIAETEPTTPNPLTAFEDSDKALPQSAATPEATETN